MFGKSGKDNLEALKKRKQKLEWEIYNNEVKTEELKKELTEIIEKIKRSSQ